MISPRQKPAGSAYLLVCCFAQVPSAALQRAELLRGVGSSVLASAPRESAGGWAGCPQLLALLPRLRVVSSVLVGRSALSQLGRSREDDLWETMLL